METVELGIALLEGGNSTIQVRLYQKDVSFDCVREMSDDLATKDGECTFDVHSRSILRWVKRKLYCS